MTLHISIVNGASITLCGDDAEAVLAYMGAAGLLPENWSADDAGSSYKVEPSGPFDKTMNILRDNTRN